MNCVRRVATGFAHIHPLMVIGPDDAEIGIQDSTSPGSARDAWVSNLDVRETASVLSDGRKRSSRCVTLSLNVTVTPVGHASNNATTSRINSVHSLSRTDLSAKAARCLTLTANDPNKSRTVTRVPWSKLTSLCSGGEGSCLDNTCEL